MEVYFFCSVAGRATGAAATEAPVSSLVEPAADAHHVFDDMPQRQNNSRIFFPSLFFECIHIDSLLHCSIYFVV